MYFKSLLTVFYICFLAVISPSISCQEVSLFEKATQVKVISASLKDTETIELILPKEIAMGNRNRYPVLFLFDSQNTINYQNNLQTINTLTLFGQIPPSIIVGIPLSNTGNRRNRLTMPNYRAATGLADNFLSFLLDELYPLLAKQYRAADFKIFIGHSRTAIFSLYALSKRPKEINGIIASSPSYFDFGKEQEKEWFLQSMDTIAQLQRKAFCFFSVGDTAGGDAVHYASVKALDSFMRATKLPINLQWKSYFHEGTSHFLTPLLTVAPSLNAIFDRYAQALFNVAKRPFDQDSSVVFEYIAREFADITGYYGYAVTPDFSFFNSLASHYKYNAIGPEQERFKIALAVWNKGLQSFPFSAGYYEDIAGIYNSWKDDNQYRNYLVKALNNIDKSVFTNSAEKENTRERLLQKLGRLNSK